MAMTHDYMDYLNQRVGIAPANSQEELQAAQTIAGLMGQHDVEASIEEFDAPVVAGLGAAILSIVMFLGVLVSGFGVTALAVVGFVLAVIPTALAVLRLFGRDVSLSLGPSARSQNVVAVHRACGPMVSKGNRPIVVVAHYDSPHESFLYSSPVSAYLPLITKATGPCSYVVALCALVQLLVFIPDPARIVFWLVGIVASLPSLLLAVGSVYERFSPCTLGANDNKSSVAALLGVMENVRPSGLVPTSREPEVPAEVVAGLEEPAEEAAPAEAAPAAPTEVRYVPEEVLGARHGAEVLRELGILPETCDVEYVAPAMVPVTVPATEQPTVAYAPVAEPAPVEDTPAEQPAPEAEADQPAPEPEAEDVEPVAEPAPAPAERTAPVAVPTSPAGDADDAPAAGRTAPIDVAPAEGDGDATREDLLSTGRFSLVMDGEGSRGVGPKDASGLSVTEGTFDLDSTQPTEPARTARPAAPNDPEWGKSSYRPKVTNVARRASLFDLPDPSQNEVDPFGADPDATRVRPARQSATPRVPTVPAAPASAPAPVQQQAPSAAASQGTPAVSAPAPVETMMDSSEGRSKGRLSGLLDRIKKTVSKRVPSGEDKGGDWLGEKDEPSDDPVWRGGAAPRSGLRLVGDDEQAPSEEELRDAVLSLGDDALIAHDIWFVALGASSLDHAGMRAFLRQHRSEVRGCFVVNLSCVGAGELSVLTHEGLENTRRADRRLVRLLSSSANDLHVPLAQRPFDWDSTDASPAMRTSMRSVTIMGLGDNGLPALSRTAQDVAENVSGDQAAAVTEIVTEMIRRS